MLNLNCYRYGPHLSEEKIDQTFSLIPLFSNKAVTGGKYQAKANRTSVISVDIMFSYF